MDRKKLDRIYTRIEALIVNNQLKDALDLLKDLVLNSRKGEYISQYESLDETYENMLKYSIKGVIDPERDNIYSRLLVSSLELADVSLQCAYMNESDQYVYRLKKKLEYESKSLKDDALNRIESLVLEEELADVLSVSLETNVDEAKEYRNHQEVILRIFNLIWLTDKFKESDEQLLSSIWNEKRFRWYEKAIIISGLTLSIIRCFDYKKIVLLIDFIRDDNMQISQRAMVGLFFTLYIYNDRLKLYPVVDEQISQLSNHIDMGVHFEFIAIQLLKSKETEKISKKLQEEILPEMVKFQPMLRDKLDLDNILSDDYNEDKNPDWETVFEDAPDLLDKLQEISKLQMEGSDVFMSTFARLKHFPFFADIINWFRPFYKEDHLLTEALKSQKKNIKVEAFLEGMEESFFMCNSDKYSFCLNIPQMPEMQKTMMLEMFNAELESIREIQKDDRLLNKPSAINSIYSQYIHDLYRFYKIHPMRNEFVDIFNLRFDFHNSDAIVNALKETNALRNIGEFLFEKDHFELALEVFHRLNEHGDNSLEIFEKIGYCYQNLKKYKEALGFYKKAELYDANRTWNLKKIALCYRYLKNYKESLRYYLEAEKLNPDDLYVQIFIGHSYLDMEDYEKALEYYYKVELLAEQNKKVLRPIAWCSFVLGKFETAHKYLINLIEEDANKYDFMNLGHVEWCLGNRESAIKNYKLSVNRSDNNIKSFLTGFEEDKRFLIKFGIEEKEISLVLDYLKYQL
jgi:tetratricopeptide (TPR) repeat protein